MTEEISYLTVRIPISLHQALVRHAEERQQTIQTTVRAALSTGLANEGLVSALVTSRELLADWLGDECDPDCQCIFHTIDPLLARTSHRAIEAVADVGRAVQR